MPNVNIELQGYTSEVVDSMLKRGYAKTKTEAIRLALFEFDQEHELTDDRLYAEAAGKILGEISKGREKTRKLDPSLLK